MSIDLNNKNLLKEWAKIEYADIFSSLEDFAKYYYTNGEKKCFRINTNDPWSKDNFFFGEYSELLIYYKKEHPKKHIGKKFHSLTIIDMFWQEHNGKEKLYAKCKCDCGNEVIKLFERITDGDSKSCGCLSGRNAPKNQSLSETHHELLLFWDYEKNTILDTEVTSKSERRVWWKCEECNTSFEQSVASFIKKKHCPTCDEKSRKSVVNVYPELVEDEWDYEKNDMDPKDVLISSSKLIWWKSRYGKPFQATIEERMHSVNGTSFQEQAIFYYVKQLFPDAINRGQYAFDDSGEIEIDVYIPCLHFAIEYDGVYWHKNKADRDYHKNTVLSNAGAHLLRVRGCGLDDLEDGFAEVIYHKVSPNDKGLHLRDVINEVIRSIKSYIEANQLTVDDTVQKLLATFVLTKEKLIEDRPNIYAQYVTVYQKDNISKTCLIKFWDFEKNGNLMPNNVSIKANIFVVLTCPCGHSFHIQPSLFKLNIDQEAKECKQCILKHCPAILEYPSVCDTQNCNVYKELISTSKYIPIEESKNWYYSQISFDRHQKKPEIEESNCTKLLATNPHLPYKKMQKTIANKLTKDPDSISNKNLLKYLISANGDERFDFLKTVDEIGEKISPSLIEKMQDVLNGEVSINNTFFSTDIKIPETFPVDNLMYFLKKYNFRTFSFPSLKYFDKPVVRDEFCNILLSECRKKNSVMFGINEYWLSLKIKQEIDDLSIDFLISLHKLLAQLNQVESLSELKKCQELIYPKIKDEILAWERNVSENINDEIRHCPKPSAEQVREWIRAPISTPREQIIYMLYQKGVLRYIGKDITDNTGKRFSLKNLNINFISDIEAQLGIMEILGVHRFDYDIKLFDNIKYSEKFITLIKKSADTSTEYLISGYNSDHFKKGISKNIDVLSYEFVEELYDTLLYLSTPPNRSGTCWRDTDSSEILSIIKSKLAEKKRNIVIEKKEAPTYITETKECANAEQRLVEHKHTSKIDSVTHLNGNNLNGSNEGTKKRNILYFFKSLFKRN